MLLQKLKKFCDGQPENKALLAARLGYKTTATISNWLRIGKVPGWRQKDVEAILKEARTNGTSGNRK